MKTTIFGVLLDVTPDQDTVLRRLMRKYGFMLRFAFQRLGEGRLGRRVWNRSMVCLPALGGGTSEHGRLGTAFGQRNRIAPALC